MITYEDMTGYFLKAATDLSLMTHPEYWLNTRSLEREFACTCHLGHCEDVERQCSCTVSFTWGSLDTALSLDGPEGVCEFFHEESEQDCLHLHTSSIPPLVLDLSYLLPLNGAAISEDTLCSLTQTLKLQASEYSKRSVETRPGVNMVLQDNRLQADMLTLQQRVEIPLWHPLGMHGLHDDPLLPIRRDINHIGDGDEVVADDPHPEEWLPLVMVEICQDILRVFTALNTVVSYHASDL